MKLGDAVKLKKGTKKYFIDHKYDNGSVELRDEKGRKFARSSFYFGNNYNRVRLEDLEPWVESYIGLTFTLRENGKIYICRGMSDKDLILESVDGETLIKTKRENLIEVLKIAVKIKNLETKGSKIITFDKVEKVEVGDLLKIEDKYYKVTQKINTRINTKTSNVKRMKEESIL